MTDVDFARRVVRNWLSPSDLLRVEPLTGGFVNQVFRVDSSAGSFVLRALRVDAEPRAVEWEHRLVASLSAHLPFVKNPLPVAHGSHTIVRDSGRIVSLWPYVEGAAADPSASDQRHAAARALGKLARASEGVIAPEPRPGWPAWSDLDWLDNRWWRWPPESGLSITAEQAEQVATALDRTPVVLDTLAAANLRRRPLHGDYAPSNLLVGAAGDVVALLDLDECRLDWGACDLADAVWAFCRRRDGSGLDGEAAAAFVDEYRAAGGPLDADERAALPDLIRARRLWEAPFDLGDFQRGYSSDLAYFAAGLRALRSVEELRSI